ncbi:FAD-dependent oxidoreductase [Gordonia terrae]
MSDHNSDFDVVVVGAGGAGLAAAATAAENGSRAIVFEAESSIGGSTALSSGMFTAAGTSVQESAGIADSADRMFQHYMDLNQWRVLPGPTRAFCRETADVVDWLLALGVDVPPLQTTNAHESGITRAGMEDSARGHVPRGEGQAIVDVLSRRCASLGVDVVLNTRVDDLVRSGDGSIAGVRVDETEVSAPNVVVASGGFTRDVHALERYFPEGLAAGDDLFVVSGTGSRGDHLRFADKHRLGLFGHGWGLTVLTARIQTAHHWTSGFPPPSRLYVDGNGVRCMDEDAPYAISGGIYRDRGGVMWAVFDEAGRLALPEGYKDWSPDRVSEEVQRGTIETADTVEQLAARMGVPGVALAGSVAAFNDYCHSGVDDEFLRHETRAAKRQPTPPAVDTGPYYAVRLVPGELVCTHTGLRIDDRARVQDELGRAVPGLYAAGEAAGGVLGNRYVGGGNAVAHALAFGRIAGRNLRTSPTTHARRESEAGRS